MITTETKTKILIELQKRRDLFAGSDTKFATSIGINNSQYSRIKKGELERVISEEAWITLARQLNVMMGKGIE
jgi:hypothetical protein